MGWDGIFFRCLPIYRHLKKKKKSKEHLFLKNSQQTWLETGLKSCQKTWLKNLLKRRGGLSPCGRQGHMGMDPNKSPPPDPCQNGRRKTQKPLAGFHASEHRTKLHLLLWNDFCHHVSCILVCVNLLQLESFLLCSITNPVISDFNMFCSRVICGILAQVYCTLTVAIYHILILLHTQFFEECLYPY